MSKVLKNALAVVEAYLDLKDNFLQANKLRPSLTAAAEAAVKTGGAVKLVHHKNSTELVITTGKD